MIKKCKSKSHRDLLEEYVTFPDKLWTTIKKKNSRRALKEPWVRPSP